MRSLEVGMRVVVMIRQLDLALFPRELTLLSQSYGHSGQEHLIVESLKTRLYQHHRKNTTTHSPHIKSEQTKLIIALSIYLGLKILSHSLSGVPDYWNPHKKFYLLVTINILNMTASWRHSRNLLKGIPAHLGHWRRIMESPEMIFLTYRSPG